MRKNEIILPGKPPFVFPEPRILAGVAGYNDIITYTGILPSAKYVFLEPYMGLTRMEPAGWKNNYMIILQCSAA